MYIHFPLTFWSSHKKGKNGWITHCIEMGTTYECKGGNSCAKSYITALQSSYDLFHYMLDHGVLEDELLCRGWVLMKTFRTIQWHYPNPEIKIAELQHIFQEEGSIQTHTVMLDIIHEPKHGLRFMLKPGEK